MTDPRIPQEAEAPADLRAQADRLLAEVHREDLCTHGRIDYRPCDECRISQVAKWLEAFATAQRAAALRELWQPVESIPKGEIALLKSASGGMLLGKWGDYDVYNAPKFTHGILISSLSDAEVSALPAVGRTPE